MTFKTRIGTISSTEMTTEESEQLKELIQQWRTSGLELKDADLLINLLISERDTDIKIKPINTKYRHFKGGEYTLLYDDVYDSDVGPNSPKYAVYVGEDGRKWLRKSDDFHGHIKKKRFKEI